MNLYDVTLGNYHVDRTVTYPDYPKSKIVFDTTVKAVSETEWSTEIGVSGRYDGPTDVVGAEDYRVEWRSDGKALHERGTATLRLRSGEGVRTAWTSIITTDSQALAAFPQQGEIVDVEYTPFEVDGGKMSYEWTGSVRLADKQ